MSLPSKKYSAWADPPSSVLLVVVVAADADGAAVVVVVVVGADGVDGVDAEADVAVAVRAGACGWALRFWPLPRRAEEERPPP